MNELTYTRCGDYYIPDLKLSEQPEAPIGKYGRMRMDAMLPRMMEAAGVTEELKASDPMRWVGLMNTLKVQVEETIFQELIFQ